MRAPQMLAGTNAADNCASPSTRNGVRISYWRQDCVPVADDRFSPPQLAGQLTLPGSFVDRHMMDEVDSFEMPLRYSAWVMGIEGEVRLLVAFDGFTSPHAAQEFLGELVADEDDRTIH